MRLHVVFAAQVAKELECPDLIEDAYAVSVDGDAAAISDGASESFDSRNWAQLLVTSFVTAKSWSETQYRDALERYQGLHQFSNLSWSKKASFERGSFATLLGIRLDGAQSRVHLTGIGDCLALLVANGNVVASFPYKTSLEFAERPVLLSTRRLHGESVSEEVFMQGGNETLDVQIGDVLLVMSDAIAAWTLAGIEAEDSPVGELLALSTTDELLQLVIRERLAHAMRTDDVTLIVLRIADGSPHELSVA